MGWPVVRVMKTPPLPSGGADEIGPLVDMVT
jgi:hypothetical protein